MSRPIPEDLAKTRFDAIIIGAGINGAGIARDAALRGLKVLLLDKGDLAAGTSSWSSRLIHGGLRYLEHGELGLVRESLRERERLLRLAPHLVRPLGMLIPIYEHGRRGRLLIRAGMMAYDLLSFDKSLGRHRMLSRAEAGKRAPGLSPHGLLGAAVYYDAQVEFAERLVVENALAAESLGAKVLTYARVDRLLMAGNIVRGVAFIDLSGGKQHEVHAAVTINVAGPWVDEVLTGARPQPGPLIGGTKGSHLVVAKLEGAPASEALYVEAAEDGRPFFILPWNGKYLIGTTDIRFEGDLDRLTASDSEIAYLLAETNRVLPEAKLTRADVLYTYAGVRPLPRVGSAQESAITRRHFVHDHAPTLNNFLSIIGGKLTTYRSLSEEAVDLLFKKLGRARAPCVTDVRPLPGALTDDAAAFRARLKERYGDVAESVIERLWRVYGTRAAEVLALASEDGALCAVFDEETGALSAEVVFAFRSEMAQTLCDCLLRRTMVGLNASAGLNAVEAAAQIGRRFLGWTASRAADEITAYKEYVSRFQPRVHRRDAEKSQRHAEA